MSGIALLLVKIWASLSIKHLYIEPVSLSLIDGLLVVRV